MLKQSSVLLLAAALVGCASNGNDSARTTAQAPTAPELAAYAGAHKYPATQPASNDLRAAAIVSRDRGIIKIYNFTNQPVANPDVWVNEAFVQHLPGIAPGSAPVVIRFSDLYNGLGQQFSSQNEQVRSVQIESDGKLYTLQGPAAD